MDTDKIVQDLNRRFAAPLPEFYQRRIISGTMKIRNLRIRWTKWFWKMQR